MTPGGVRHHSSSGRAARIGALALLLSLLSLTASAQEQGRAFAGGLFGVSTLSADGRAETSGSAVALSLYEPKNGPALNLLAGLHVAEYFAVQANWIWNRNDLTLVSSFATPQGGGFYEQRRRGSQHAFVLDGLLYFRGRASAVRPYLGTGITLLHFSSDDIIASSSQGLAAPENRIVATRIGLRSHVGVDLRLSRRVSFRYSFSETITANPISRVLSPPAPRRLANFQNLFGLVGRL